jgi:phosphate transport system substrate-binding protein
MKLNFRLSISFFVFCATAVTLITGCKDFFKNDYDDNSPTSGKLNVYYDEGLEPHIINQVNTFESQYAQVKLDLHARSESEAVQALYSDSCESIIISRLLSEAEKKSFASKDFFPDYSAVAKSGVALITNIQTQVSALSMADVITLLTKPFSFKDSLGNAINLNVIFDKNNSSVIHYLKDSILKGANFSKNCNILNSTLQSINFVAKNKNTIAFIDYAWLSDVDDSLYKANIDKIKFICVSALNDSVFAYPNQSSFKLNTYPFTRTVFVYRKTGDFTLAKGFESYIAGPKGQLTFLKQGLLPTRQSERKIEINTKSLNQSEK